jgi:excisionase family DNA binding protein
VQRLLGHSNPRITSETYGHLAPEYLLSEAARLRFELGPDTVPRPSPKGSAHRERTRFSLRPCYGSRDAAVVRPLGASFVQSGAVDAGSVRWVSVRELAAILRVSTSTVYQAVAAGEIPHVRVSNAIRIAVRHEKRTRDAPHSRAKPSGKGI